MTNKILRGIRLLIAIALVNAAAFSQASPHDQYVGTWKGEMNVGRMVPVEFVFEREGTSLKGFVVDPSGAKVPLKQVYGFASGTVFRMDRDETNFMVFAGQLSNDKTSLSGDVTIMEGKVERGKAKWSAKKVIASAAPAPALAGPTTRIPAAQAAYERGLPFIRSRAFNAAVAAFTQCLKADAKDVGCLVLRGISQNGLFKYKEALVDLNAAIQLSPKPSAAFLIARAEARNGVEDYDGVIADADAAFKINATPDSYLMRGISRMKRAGLIYFDSIMRGTDAKVKPEALKLAAQGLAEINEFIKLKPQDYRGYHQRGYYQYQMWNVFSETKDMRPALNDLDKAISLAPQIAGVYHTRYLVHEAIGNKDLAAADHAKYNELFKK